MRRPSVRTLFVVGLVLLALAQLIRPARTNPPTDPSRTIAARTNMTPEIQAIFDRSCRDCHTNNTRWPWYSQVAPMSWVLIWHVNEGRDHMLLSDWASYSPTDASSLLGEICEEVEGGGMPLRSYLLAHRDATLTDADVTALCAWTQRERATARR